nr:hypothetical protein [Nocardioides panacis]
MERTQDALQAEPFGQCHEGDQQDDGRTHPDLRGRVLQAGQRHVEAAGPGDVGDHDRRRGDEGREADEEHQPAAGTCVRA